MYKFWMKKHKELIDGMPHHMKLQHCAYNWRTEGFQLWYCIENGMKSKKQTFNKKIPFRINRNHR